MWTSTTTPRESDNRPISVAAARIAFPQRRRGGLPSIIVAPQMPIVRLDRPVPVKRDRKFVGLGRSRRVRTEAVCRAPGHKAKRSDQPAGTGSGGSATTVPLVRSTPVVVAVPDGVDC
jgi:hypothetical protein